MLRRSLALLALAAPASAAVPDWVAELRSGGFVLYMRHGVTDRSQVDTGRLGDRAGQRNLSLAGIRLAEQVSATFARLAIPIRAVRSSPVFRASDTATIMARGMPVDVTMDLVADDYTVDVAAAAASLRRALTAAPAAGTNTLLVGHIQKLALVLGRPLSQQEFPENGVAIVQPEPPDGFALRRILAPDVILAAAT
ncbi:hypothetical protein GXW78_06410 [Roseomonas terrae]|uniref:Histidine phosphatase family protein n=1 Tax=Neoroseomonas terrae TaxID=424799 RepID=A0ABS5EE38_9PROT|nr:histidine phosphatase family protein [Neoroseomonas terrae]MBR0649286.1 hypothetical protein [Neoroseomonas terrae]